MKEQWKKLDNDAKLLVDVEEGNQLPIKINIPLSALTPPKDEFCCNRLLTVLRVCVLFTLLALLGWTATTVYFNYYDRSIPIGQENLENKFIFQSLVYKNKDAVQTDYQFKNSNPEVEEFRESTKKALDQIAVEMKGVNERLDQLQVEKEQQQIDIQTPLYNAKSFDDGVVTSDRSDQSLDSMMDELARDMGLSDNGLPDTIHLENKPELGAIIITEPQDDEFTELKKEFDQTMQELGAQLEKLNIEQGLSVMIPPIIDENLGEFNYRSKLSGDFSQQPIEIDDYWNKNSDLESQKLQKAFLDLLQKMAKETVVDVNVDESHDEDKEVDQVIKVVINSKATSNLDNDSEQQNEKENKVEDETMEEQDENLEESFMNELIDGFMDTLFGEENAKEDESESFDNENVEESPNEDKVEKEMIEQHVQDEMFRDILGESLVDMVFRELEEEMNVEEKSSDNGSNLSLLHGRINFPTIPFETLSGETIFSPENGDGSEDGSSDALFENLFDIMLKNDENNDDISTANPKENSYYSVPYQKYGEIDAQEPTLSGKASEDVSSFPTFGESYDSLINYDYDYKEPEPTAVSEGQTEYIPLPAGYISRQMDYQDPRFFKVIAEEPTGEFHESFLPISDFVEPNTSNMENKEMNINEQAPIQKDSSEKKTLIDMIPSVEYVKKIEENPFIPKVAKMLEPIVGSNHELLIWYYSHKNLPNFLRGTDKWKVFGAKLLYDSNIKDYPADATIVSGLTFEKVYGGAEYPSSIEEARSDLEQEIINRLILKSYLNKMLLEGNAEAETLSQVIEQHNLEKLKELDVDPQQLTYNGDFFQVDNNRKEDIMIPVVHFDPFVDESREANEQRVQVIRAFERSRNMEDDQPRNGYFDSITSAASEQVDGPELLTTVIPKDTNDNVEESRQVLPQNSEDFSVNSDEFETSNEGSESFRRDPYEPLDDWLTEFAPNDGPIRFRR